jgi:hypothetical protein
MATTQAPVATPTFTSFDGHRRLASGTLADNALAVRRALEAGAAGPVLIFADESGRCIDVDTRGSDAEIRARYPVVAAAEADAPSADAPRGRGRPRLGVVAREITLLPRHWDWLAVQPGGVSVALRKLVDEARRADGGAAARRQARDRAYHFMSAMAGDLPGFEEASRALFAGDAARLAGCMADWPEDVRAHVAWLAAGEPELG